MTIWFKAEGKKPERIDSCSKQDSAYMLREYRMAFGLLTGQHRYGKDKLWIGTKADEPKE